MQQQKQQKARSRPKFNLKRIVFYVRIILFVVMLLGVLVTSVLSAVTGISVYSALSGIILSVATVLGVSSFFVPVQSTTTQSTSNTAPTSPNNMQRGSVAQNTSAKTGQSIFFFNMPLRDPNEFYGHTAARTTLIARTANGGSSSIVGERRAGKTWLLTYLQLIAPTHSKLGSAYRIASISAEHPRCKSLAGVVQWVLEELSVSQASHDLSLQPLDQLSQGVRTLKRLGIRPVLCIDEFEGFDNRQEFDVDFVEGLRAMAQSDGLILITASKRPLKELIEDLTGETSPLFNIVQQISLQPFTEQEAHEFVRDKSNMAGFTEKESDFFFSQSTLHNTHGGEPYWPPLRLQLVGQMLLDDKQAAQGEPLDDKLDTFRYRSDFEIRLNETYQAVVR
jgi:AAA domain-containing protein